MAVEKEQSRLIFRKLERGLGKLSSKPKPENVHQFRTYTRRVQTLLKELTPEHGRNEDKLLKLLAEVRKRAGKVRDLDVQISALRSLKIPQEPRRKTQLLEALAESRAQREEKLLRALDPKTVREIRRRLKKAAGRVQLDGNLDPLAVATRIMAQAARQNAPVSEDVLHQYRIVSKRARYAVEFAAKSSEAEQFMAQLKRVQDALGDWHDWLTLTETAKQRFGSVQESALVAALQNITGAKFRNAVAVVSEARATIGAKKAPFFEPVTTRKRPVRSAEAAPAA